MIIPSPRTAASLALGVLLLVTGCSETSTAKPAAPAGPAAGGPPVSVAPTVMKAISDVEEFTGRLEAPESVEVRARIGGTIDRVHFRDGATVNAGDLLFTIDPRPYEAELERGQAQLAVTRAQADLARSELARAQKLLDAKAVSRQEFDQLTSSVRTSEAGIRAGEAAVRIARLNLDYSKVRAPISGHISRAAVTAGNVVDEKTVLTTLVGTRRVFAYFDGSEQTYLRLRKADTSQLTVKMGLADEAGLPHEGRIDFIDNRLNGQTGAIRMRAVFDNAAGQFAPGLFARMQLGGGVTRDAVLTPDRAIGTDQSRKFVLVLGEGNVAELRDVKPGPLLDGMRVIESGLKAGELVVVNGLQRARPGMPVTPEKLEVDARGMPIEKPPAAPAAPARPKSS